MGCEQDVRLGMLPQPLQACRHAEERAGKLVHTEQERALALQQLCWAQHRALPKDGILLQLCTHALITFCS